MSARKTLPPLAEVPYALKEKLTAARVAFMNDCPFFCYYYYDQLKEYPTRGVYSAATDGRRVYYNPDYLETLSVPEICFVLAHETYHAVWEHPTRMVYYNGTKKIGKLPYNQHLFNTAADYVINADLVKQGIGKCNPAWLFDVSIKGDELSEDVYKKIYRKSPKKPPPPGGQPGSQPGQGSGEEPEEDDNPQPKTKGGVGKRDKLAEEKGGSFDELEEPFQDIDGKLDIPTDIEFKEALSKAAQIAKDIGKFPASFKRIVDRSLDKQVNWREYIRNLIIGKIGSRRETWEKPNRRRIVLNPMVYMPGKRGYGCELAVVWIDTSGSITKEEYNAFFAEVGGIFVDVRPRQLLVGFCDAAVHRTVWCSSLDEVYDKAYEAGSGGGGTDFRPPFEWMKNEKLKPDTLVYLTDMEGNFPKEKPDYHVVWCKTTDIKAPFGDEVKLIA
jgi:predicted metal-dependent peptidase